MQSLSFRRAAVRAVLSFVILGAAAACSSDHITNPAPSRPSPSAGAKLDGDPGPMPEESCRSGWVNIGGKWTCENP